MKSKFLTTMSLTVCLFNSASLAGARTELALQSATPDHQIAIALHENLDEFVRNYLKELRRAKSVEDLGDFLPALRMKKFRTEYSAKQKEDWLRFRKQMPHIGRLISNDIQKDKAFLLYETKERKNLPNGQEQRTMAEMTLINEDGRWKIFLEHFVTAKEKRLTFN